MRESFLARITLLKRSGAGHPDQGLPEGEGPTDPGYGLEVPSGPSHPIALPPLPGVWPPPGKPSLPIYVPEPEPGTPEHPIYIEGTPEHPIQLPPGTIWPPLPPDHLPRDKSAVLIWVVGVGARWFIYDPSLKPVPPLPPPDFGGKPQPK